jgi:hypothetical protein
VGIEIVTTFGHPVWKLPAAFRVRRLFSRTDKTRSAKAESRFSPPFPARPGVRDAKVEKNG